MPQGIAGHSKMSDSSKMTFEDFCWLFCGKVRGRAKERMRFKHRLGALWRSLIAGGPENRLQETRMRALAVSPLT